MLHMRAFVLLQGSNLLHMLEPNSSIVSILPCDLYFIILHHLTTGWGGVGVGGVNTVQPYVSDGNHGKPEPIWLIQYKFFDCFFFFTPHCLPELGHLHFVLDL